MSASTLKVLELHRTSREVMRRGVEGMIRQAEKLGMFAPYLGRTLPRGHERQPWGAWTTAEGLVALLESRAFLSGPLSRPSEELIARAAQDLFAIIDLFDNKGVPPNPDIDIPDKVVTDSTARVLIALVSLRRYVISEFASEVQVVRQSLPSPQETDWRIEGLATWLKTNQNADSGWGLWRSGSVESRTDATSVVVRAVLESGEPRDSRYVQVAREWFNRTQRAGGGWGYYPSSNTSDPISTAYALMALAEIEPLSSSAIRKGVDFLRQVEDWQDVELQILVPRPGHKFATVVPQLFPAYARAICALVKCGESPCDPFVLSLVERQMERELEGGGWAHEGADTIETWYTYAVVDSLQIWNYYLQETGVLPRLVAISLTVPGLGRTIQQFQKEGLVLSDGLRDSNRELANLRKIRASLVKRNTILLVALILSGLANGLMLWHVSKLWIALLALLPNLGIALALGVAANTLYEWLKHVYNRLKRKSQAKGATKKEP